MELNASLSALLTGMVIPFIVPIITNEKWSSKWKTLFVAGLSIIAGFVNAWLNSNIADVPTVMMSVVVIYQMFNKSGVFDSIETATTLNQIKDAEDLTVPEGYNQETKEVKL